MPIRHAFAACVVAASAATAVSAQTFLPGNHSIGGSLCVGADCTSVESFGVNALKLKSESNHVLFDDTTTHPQFPRHDWSLLVNDNSQFGENHVSVRDETSGTTIFRIAGGAPEHTLAISQVGYVGIGTRFPSERLHIARGGDPTIMLEQTTAGGQPPRRWRIIANEIGFEINDTTGVTTPFRVQAGAEQGTFEIAAAGRVGIGTAAPSAQLHLRRANGTARVFVQETSATAAPRKLLDLRNNGRPEIVMGNSNTGGEWSFGAGTNFILKQGALGSASSAKTTLLQIDPSGNASLTGTLTTGGTTCGGGCDAVFASGYALPSIAEHAERMFALGHLPNVGPTPEGAPIDVTDKLGRMLNELEHAHIYIARLEARLAALEARSPAE